jgi:Flp pilus assembly protein TadB
MLEVAAAVCAGAAITVAVLVVGMPVRIAETAAGGWLGTEARTWWTRESDLATSSGWPWLDGPTLLLSELVAAAGGAAIAVLLTGLPVLGVPASVGAIAVVRVAVGARARRQRRLRQDAVLEAVRMLRQVLEVGAASVQQAIAVLADRGPVALRDEFRLIAATTLGRRQAWCAARDRIGEPLFDMLAAAVLIQGPGGGELAPLFAELEATVAAAQEVEREAEALQVQARSAAGIIVSLPIVFLIVLSTFRSPYLDAFHALTGQLFLLLMLGVMGGSYLWMRRLLRLEGLQRVRLSDA